MKIRFLALLTAILLTVGMNTPVHAVQTRSTTRIEQLWVRQKDGTVQQMVFYRNEQGVTRKVIKQTNRHSQGRIYVHSGKKELM